MTVAVTGDELILEQIENQLRKLQDVRHIKKLADQESVCRELLMVKIKANEAERQGIISLTEIFKAKIADVEKNSLIVELVGNQSKLEAFISLLDGYEILELARTGITGLSRGSEDVQFF